MSKINNAFSNEKAFISFVTAGDPDLETTEKLIIAMQKAGADLIEIGIPFSDPIAEGSVIQNADDRALKAGCTTDKIFNMVKSIRKTVTIPLAFMTYINPIFTYGKERFLKNCSDCGIDALIIPDLPFEEKGELSEICDKYGVDLISLIAPTSKERITMIAKQAKGFIYCVSSLGVTGVRSEIKTDISEMVSLVKSVSDIPCAVGFGISTPEQAAKLVLNGAKLIGTNTDLTCPTESGIVPACRALVAPIEVTTGKKAYYIGKPNPLMMRTGLHLLGVHSEEAAMIGDRMDTDIIAGIESGLDPILVLSGITSRESMKQYPYQPRLILSGVGDIAR